MWTGHNRQNAERNFSTADITKSSRNESTRFFRLLQYTYSTTATQHTFTLDFEHYQYNVLRDIVNTTPKCPLPRQPCSLFSRTTSNGWEVLTAAEGRGSLHEGPMIPASKEPLQNP